MMIRLLLTPYKAYRDIARILNQFISVSMLKFMHVKYSPDIRFRGKSTLLIRGYARFGKQFTLQSGPIYSFDGGSRCKIDVAKGASLEIGDFSGISNTTISCMRHIKIGNYVNIGGQSIIMDSNFHSLNWEDRIIPSQDKLNARTSEVTIEDHVFIGARCIICKGVTIGEKSIVAAGSVVVNNIPANEMWGGNPAKFIKKVENICY